MNIKITVKQLGKKRDKITDINFSLSNRPATVEEFIKEAVYTCVADYNLQVNKGENVRPLEDADIENMSEIGKIAFGINYKGKIADINDATDVALQAFADGLVRIFKGDEEFIDLAQSIDIQENDRFTFIKLVMLAGRMF